MFYDYSHVKIKYLYNYNMVIKFSKTHNKITITVSSFLKKVNVFFTGAPET